MAIMVGHSRWGTGIGTPEGYAREAAVRGFSARGKARIAALVRFCARGRRRWRVDAPRRRDREGWGSRLADLTAFEEMIREETLANGCIYFGVRCRSWWESGTG